MRSDFCFFCCWLYSIYMWNGISRRVLWCWRCLRVGMTHSTILDKTVARVRKGRHERSSLNDGRKCLQQSIRRRSGCASHVPLDHWSASVSEERRLPRQQGTACFRVIPGCALFKIKVNAPHLSGDMEKALSTWNFSSWSLCLRSPHVGFAVFFSVLKINTHDLL